VKIQLFFPKLIDDIFFFCLKLSLRLRRYRKSKPPPEIAAIFNILTLDTWLTTRRIKELAQLSKGCNQTIEFYYWCLSGLSLRKFVECKKTDNPCSLAEVQWKLTDEGAAEQQRRKTQ